MTKTAALMNGFTAQAIEVGWRFLTEKAILLPAGKLRLIPLNSLSPFEIEETDLATHLDPWMESPEILKHCSGTTLGCTDNDEIRKVLSHLRKSNILSCYKNWFCGQA